MARNLNPIVRQELENLDKDADSRQSAMRALKSYVKDMDSKAIPLFLAQVSETNEMGSSSGAYTISLYEVLARVHGPKIVPLIDNIMATIVKTLNSSAGSFALHQACSKVVPAIARYGIDPNTSEDTKRHVVHSLCKPLSDSLLGGQESLSTGSALCLKALVDCDNWRFASGEMVNEVCQRVVGALERPLQTNSHMGLVMSLAKHNSLTVEAYCRLLIQSGLRILKAGVVEGNSQKRLSSIQMVNFIMKCLDPKSLFSELGLIIKEMEACQSDQMAYVRAAALEALQTARRIAAEEESKFEWKIGSRTVSNCSRRRNGWKNLKGAAKRSPRATSPESHTIDSFVGFDSVTESPISVNEISQNLDFDQRSVNRRLWRRYENGGVDVSLKDGLYTEVTCGSVTDNSERNDFLYDRGDYADGFSGFLQGSPRNGTPRSTTPSPLKSRPQIDIDHVIFTTPRKLLHSLQDSNRASLEFSVKQTSWLRSPSPSKFEWSPMSNCDQNGVSHDMHHEDKRDENMCVGEQFLSGSESVSSTDAPADADLQVSQNEIPGIKIETQSFNVLKRHQMSFHKMICGFLVLFSVFICVLLIDDHYEGHNLVPT